MADISTEELHFLFELMERRSDSTSTIFCTQYSKKDWVKKLGQGVYAEAIVDRYAYTTFFMVFGNIIYKRGNGNILPYNPSLPVYL